jgi:MFS family permease
VKPLLATLSLGVFAGALDLSVLSPALPAIGHQFDDATNDLAWIFTLYLLVTVLSIAVASTLADRYGRRPVYLACISLFAIGSIVAIFAPNYGIFLLARAIQALGAGGIFPVATATIGDVVPQERRGAALGMVAGMWGLAAVIGPALGGLVTHYISWRWIFVANVPLAIAVFAMARKNVPEVAPNTRDPLDVFGLILLCTGLLGVMDGLLAMRWPIGVAGALFLVAFLFWQRIARFPIVPASLLASPQLVKTYALEIVIGVLEGSLFFIPTVLVATQGLTYAAAGLIAALGGFTFVAVIPVSGRAIDRLGSRDVLLAGTVLTELGLAIFALGFQSLWLTILSMIVAGCGFGALLGAPTRYIVTNETTDRTRATAVGLLSQCLIVGQIIGSSLAGLFIGLSTSEFLGYRHAYLAFCATAFVALVLAAMLQSRTQERTSPLSP